MLNLSSLSTQSLASCVNYFVWNCLTCFSNTKIGSVTSFSILFNFQGPVSASAIRLKTWLFYHRSDFLSSSFFEVFRDSDLSGELGALSVSRRWPELSDVYWFFSLYFQPGLRSHSFVSALGAWRLALGAWRLSIIPYAGPLCKPFLQVFCSFFAFGLFIQFFSPFYPVFCFPFFLL